MKKTLSEYILDTEQTYSYRIKTILPLDDNHMSAIEALIMKYDPIDISNQRRSIFQPRPADFTNAAPLGAEVYTVDVTLGLPASGFVLTQEIAKALRCSEKFVVVRGVNDPLENEQQRVEAEAAIAAEAEKAGLMPAALLLDAGYNESDTPKAEDLYGDAYNSKFVAHLKKLTDKKREEDAKSTPTSPLYDFLAPIVNAEDASAKAAKAAGENAADEQRGIHGNFDDDKKQFRRVFRDKSGKSKVLSKDADGIRKDL